MRVLRRVVYLICVTVWLGAGAAARGDVVIHAQETGDDVVWSGSGSMSLPLLMFFHDGGVSSITPTFPAFQVVTGDTRSMRFPIVKSPANFGTGPTANASSSTGDIFGVIPAATDNVRVDDDYQSGAPLSFTMTFDDSSFDSLGMRPGSYQWVTATDTIALNIGAVPAPSTLAAMGVGTLGMLLLHRKRRITRARQRVEKHR